VKHPFLRTILLAALAICAAGLASAQTPQAATPSQADVDKAIAQLRADAAKDVNAIIGASMNFTSDEAAKFWPLYKPYETQRKALMDERLAIIKEYARTTPRCPTRRPPSCAAGPRPREKARRKRASWRTAESAAGQDRRPLLSGEHADRPVARPVVRPDVRSSSRPCGVRQNSHQLSAIAGEAES